jgi:glyoxylase-like metal-dependent hydrolase (beta-lactamase superfamily II)
MRTEGRVFGGIECTILSDGWNDYDPEVIFANIAPDRWEPFTGQQLTPDGSLRLPYHAMLLRSEGRVVLVDSGLGALASPEGSAGKLLQSLQAEGCGPEDVDTVIVSHAHPDHIGGLVRITDGHPVPRFPRARVLMSKDEWNFWTSDASAGMPDTMRRATQLVLPALRDAAVIDTTDGDSELLAGISTLAAPGHTPGHMAILISPDERGAIYLGDAVVHQAQVENPDWVSAVDHDPVQTVASRRRLLELASARDLQAMAFHVADPGRVSRVDGRFRFVPE